jgi:hypothetical protein
VLHEADQPILTDTVEKARNVGVQNVAHLSRIDSDKESIQRIVLAALRSEPIAEPEEVLLVDLVQHRRRRPLDDLVLKGGNRKRPLLSVWLRYIGPP